MEVTAIKRELALWLDEESAQPPLLVVGGAAQEISIYARQYAVCTDPKKPCTVCVACVQALAGVHPDIVVAEGTERTISTKEIKRLLATTSSTSLHGKRLFVVPHAERLSDSAVASLLKTLEEPAAKTRWLLFTGFKRRILLTILSRCIVLRAGQQQSAGEPAAMPVFGQTVELLPDELEALTAYLQRELRQTGYTPALHKSWMRLRDYYKIKSQRGNEKLAGQVLLATLSELQLKP